jgi:hypothetical protein
VLPLCSKFPRHYYLGSGPFRKETRSVSESSIEKSKVSVNISHALQFVRRRSGGGAPQTTVGEFKASTDQLIGFSDNDERSS